jgi:hypothetical protein
MGCAPVAWDYDGDGKTDYAVYQASSGYWFVWLSGTDSLAYQFFGAEEVAPVVGDYDGDGRTDFAIYQAGSGLWGVLLSSNGEIFTAGFGGPGIAPVQ